LGAASRQTEELRKVVGQIKRPSWHFPEELELVQTRLLHIVERSYRRIQRLNQRHSHLLAYPIDGFVVPRLIGSLLNHIGPVRVSPRKFDRIRLNRHSEGWLPRDRSLDRLKF
jgi:hypothetical protein